MLTWLKKALDWLAPSNPRDVRMFSHEVVIYWEWDSSIPAAEEAAKFDPILDDLERECGGDVQVGYDIEGKQASITVETNDKARTRSACERVAAKWKLPGAVVE